MVRGGDGALDGEAWGGLESRIPTGTGMALRHECTYLGCTPIGGLRRAQRGSNRPLLAGTGSALGGRSKDDGAPAARSRWLFEVEALLRQVIRGDLSVDAIQSGLEAALEADGTQRREGDSAGDILADLGIATGANPNWFSWPDLAERFTERKGRSFWWAEPSPRQPPRQIIHNGAPDEDLFELLMAGWAERPGQHRADWE